MLNKFIKAVIIICVSFLALLSLLIVLIRFGYVNHYITNTMTHFSNQNINGELYIDFIEGNIFSEFEIHDIRLIKIMIQ